MTMKMNRPRGRRLLPEGGYGVGIAAKVAGLNLRTVQRWTDQGVIIPSISQGKGKGSVDVFSFSDVVTLRTLGRLKQAGISLQQIKKALEALEQIRTTRDLHNIHLVSTGADIYLSTGRAVTSLLKQPGQMAFLWIIPLAEVQAEVKEALRKAA